MSRTSRLGGLLLAIACLLPAPGAYADNNLEYILCCEACNSDPLHWMQCVVKCKDKYRKQKHWINLFNLSASPGYGESNGRPYIFSPSPDPITAKIEVTSPDPLNGICFYLRYDGYNPDPPPIGLFIGEDTDPTDGWSITFDPAAYGFVEGILIAVGDFPTQPPEVNNNIEVIVCSTVEPPLGPPRYVDLRPDSMQLTVVPGGFVEVQVAYSALVGGFDVVPPIHTVALVLVDEVPVADASLDVDVLPGIPPCAVSVPPGCFGDCPPPATCADVDLWGSAYDYCACAWPALVVMIVPAMPGDRIVVHLDDPYLIDEADEENNWIEGFVPLRGDLNCDGAVDFDDINPFVTALVGRAGYEAAYPWCNWLNADINGNGAVDFDDINPFVSCLVAGECP